MLYMCACTCGFRIRMYLFEKRTAARITDEVVTSGFSIWTIDCSCVLIDAVPSRCLM